ncbi:hypothetical protein [Pseudarthrobacter sp. efr-133-R2A-89]|uniref:hypothetical protein n=1 Tax=Pseudarthrobacter sp. efr-133-R2A-89 TaxID=3040302 RepID=UPI002556B679|nr:hypothetical protein [Pseudarthrobacter sp. efr-133-R2A-89]
MADRISTGGSGNIGSAVVNALLLYGLNIWPGWQVLPFLTSGMVRVLDLINASLIAGIVVGVVCVLIRARALLAVGNLVALGFGVAAIIRVWEVFPFDFTGGWTGWPVLVRVLLVIAMVGSVFGAVAELVNLVRALAGVEPRPRKR